MGPLDFVCVVDLFPEKLHRRRNCCFCQISVLLEHHVAVFFAQESDQSAEDFGSDELVVELSRHLVVLQKILEENFERFEHLVDDDHGGEAVNPDCGGRKVEEEDESIALENEDDVDFICYFTVFRVANDVDFVRVDVFLLPKETVDDLRFKLIN